jgi:ATP-dependent helicase HrpA
VSKRFSEIAGERISPDHFRLHKLAPHLRMRLQVVDDDGNEQVASRDISELQKDIASDHGTTVSEAIQESEWHRDGVEVWDFGDLPTEVRVPRGSIEVVLFPALVEFADATLGLRLEETSSVAEVATRKGARRLFQSLNRTSLRSQVRYLPRWNEVCLWSASLLPQDRLEDQLALLIAEVAFLHEHKTPRTQIDFEARQQDAGQRIAAATQVVASVIPDMMLAYHQVRLALADLAAARFGPTRLDIETQLARLMHVSFLGDTPWDWLSQFPRYLNGIAYRIDKLTSGSVAKEEMAIRELKEFWSRIETCDESSNVVNRAELVEYRWMLEEYRISLFAQSLGTIMKVSAQRLDKQWKKTDC